MTREKPVRVGIVGCGIISQWQHIPSFLRIKGAEIAAICDRDQALLAQVGGSLRNAVRYDDFTQMLAREKLDMVDICTPPQTHAALSLEAAESGCHVLVEKPAALSLEEFDRVAEACVRNGVKLCQIQNKMFEPVVIGALSHVAKGGIGVVVGVNVQVRAKRTATLAKAQGHWTGGLPGGIFTELLPHPIYFIQAFLGEVDPVAVHVAGTGDDRAASSAITIILEGKKGMGTITYSDPAHKDKTIIDVHGTRKNFRIDLWNAARVEYGMGSPGQASRALENVQQAFSLLASTTGTTLSVLTRRFHGGHFNVIRDFVQSVSAESDSPVSMNQAREVIRVLEAITRMATPGAAA
jgi:UDP-N-acetyl-2-amino-2-deoxyglucuronate dehydrogenase